jgi:hypothetical protein
MSNLYKGGLIMIDKTTNMSDFTYLDNIIKNNKKFNIDDSKNIFKILSEKYDITNASAKEFDDIAKNLLETQKISELDYTLMTFDTNKDLNSDIKRNWIEQLKISAQKSLYAGDKNFYEVKIKQINILKKIESYM